MIDPPLSVSSLSSLILKYLLCQTKFSKAQFPSERLRCLKVSSLSLAEGSNKQPQLRIVVQSILTMLHKTSLSTFVLKWLHELFSLQMFWHLKIQGDFTAKITSFSEHLDTNISEVRLLSPK